MQRGRKRTWNDEVTLLKIGVTVTESGFESYGIVAEETILANRLPVGMKEFYESNKSGFAISQVFEIHAVEYEKQEYLRYDEDVYKIRRRYDSIDYIEVYCDKHDGVFEEVT